MKKAPPVFNFDSVYDIEVRPLMDQLRAICEREHMPMVAAMCISAGLAAHDGASQVASACVQGPNGLSPFDFVLFSCIFGTDGARETAKLVVLQQIVSIARQSGLKDFDELDQMLGHKILGDDSPR